MKLPSDKITDDEITAMKLRDIANWFGFNQIVFALNNLWNVTNCNLPVLQLQNFYYSSLPLLLLHQLIRAKATPFTSIKNNLGNALKRKVYLRSAKKVL